MSYERKITLRLPSIIVSIAKDEDDTSEEEDPSEGSLWVDRCMAGINSLL